MKSADFTNKSAEKSSESASKHKLNIFKNNKQESLAINNDEDKDFYNYIMDNNILNQVKITDTQITVDQHKKKFCTYEMQVSTMHVDYTIYKRFSEFFELKKEIEKQSIKIDGFPHKKWFNELNNNTIQTRKEQLNQFLDKLCNQYIRNRLFKFLVFLDLKNQFEARNIGSYVRKRQPSIFDNDGKISYKPVNDHEKEYIKILQDLKNNQDELTIYFKKLRQFLFEQKPLLSSALIALSIRGDNDFPGLIEICGSYKQDREFSSHLTCSVGLELLNDMMQFEQNIRADLYLDIFCKTNFRKLQKLNFAYHILNTKSGKCKVEALKLLKKYIEKQQNIEYSILKFIVIEEEVFKQYEKWIGHQIMTNKYNNQNQYTSDKDDPKAKDDMVQDYKHNFLSFQEQNPQKYSTPQKVRQESRMQAQQQQKQKSEQQYKFPNQEEQEESQEQKNSYLDEDSVGSEVETQEGNLKRRNKKKINTQLKKTVLVNNQSKTILNVKEIQDYIDDKSIQWESLYTYENMKVKRTLQPDNLLQISISLKMSAAQAAEIFIDQRQEWDKIKELEILDKVDNNSQLIKVTHFWQKNAKMAFLSQLCHMEVRRENNSCIYQYLSPIDRDINLEGEQHLGKCLTLVQIKDRVSKGDVQSIHKESNNSLNSADQTLDSIQTRNNQHCKIKIFKKPLDKDYFLYLCPLLLKESDQIMENYKYFLKSAKRKYTNQDEAIQELEHNNQSSHEQQQQNLLLQYQQTQ